MRPYLHLFGRVEVFGTVDKLYGILDMIIFCAVAIDRGKGGEAPAFGFVTIVSTLDPFGDHDGGDILHFSASEGGSDPVSDLTLDVIIGCFLGAAFGKREVFGDKVIKKHIVRICLGRFCRGFFSCQFIITLFDIILVSELRFFFCLES